MDAGGVGFHYDARDIVPNLRVVLHYQKALGELAYVAGDEALLTTLNILVVGHEAETIVETLYQKGMVTSMNSSAAFFTVVPK